MILVIGGRGAGKREYVKTLGYTEADMAEAVLDERPVLCGLEQLVFAAPERSMELLPALREKAVVICDEVGSGIIPAERKQREGREACGRLCIALAREASQVVRLVCGIAQVIK